MYDYLNDRFVPEMEQLKRQVGELQMRFNQPPKIDIEIEATDTDFLILQLQKIYNNFAAGCQLTIKVKLNDTGDTAGTTA